MADSQASTLPNKEQIDEIHWHSSDDKVIAQMNGLIRALQNKEVEATTLLSKLEIGFQASIHIFGMNGRHRCDDEVVTTWLSLLVTLAASEGVTGRSLASSCAKRCGGCMVYSILTAVGCFHSHENIQLAYDFFCHVLADPNGEILELQEVSKLSSLLVNTIPSREDGTFMRQVCLELHCYDHIRNISDTTKKTLEGISGLIEGLGAICTSKSFADEMKVNPTSTKQILKEAVMNKTFSRNFAEKKWP
jgi:hypothetical protein